MSTTTRRFDVAEYLTDDSEIFHYLDAAFEDGDPVLIKAALKDAARAKGMTEVARQAGMSRTGLYRALGEDGNPSLDTLSAILSTFGMRLAVASRAEASPAGGTLPIERAAG